MAEHDDIRARLAVYKADMEYLTKEGRVDEINVTNARYISDIKTLWKRIHELEVEREKISALFPDDATHKHAQTGESLYDNIQDALRDLAKAKADLAAAREDVARMQKSIRKIRCTCYCKVHGPGCGAQESTCRDIVRCDRCKAIDSARAKGGK